MKNFQVYSAAHRTALEVAKEAKTSIEHAKEGLQSCTIPLKFTKMLSTKSAKNIQSFVLPRATMKYHHSMKPRNASMIYRQLANKILTMDDEAAIAQALDKMYLFEAFAQHCLSV